MTSIWTEFNDDYEDKAVIGLCIEDLKGTILTRNHFNKWMYFLNCHINQPCYLIMASKKGYILTIPKPKPLFLVDIQLINLKSILLIE